MEWIRMTSGGARKLAARLTEKADELDRLGKVPASGVKSARSQKKGDKSVTDGPSRRTLAQRGPHVRE